MADARYVIQLFDKALHDRRAFSCGVEAMDRWIRYSVSDQVIACRSMDVRRKMIRMGK